MSPRHLGLLSLVLLGSNVPAGRAADKFEILPPLRPASVRAMAQPAPDKLPADKLPAATTPTAPPVLSTEAWREPGRAAWSIYGGGGVDLLTPRFQDNPAFRVNGATHNFSQNLDAAPLGWVGVWRDDWGFRARWFQYAQGSAASFLNPGGSVIDTAKPLGLGATSTFAGERTSAFSDLNVLTWDFEFTKRFQWNRWTIDAAAGARYAHLLQSYSAYVGEVEVPPPPPPPPPPVIPSAFDLDFAHNFNGAGPTFALELHRQLGATSLAFYCNSRMSVLFGRAKEVAVLEETKAGAEVATNSASTSYFHVIPVGELEVGAECVHSFGRLRTLVQAGFVGQVWWNSGNAANNNGSLGLDNRSNFGFLGLTIRVGLQF